MDPLPSVSIVTISFDQAGFLPVCLDSVCSQKAPGVEYIVVDPGSTDGSREILHAYAARGGIDRLVMEPDQGPADGLNKGFALATGEIFGYINSDDRIAKGALNYVRRFFAAYKDVDVLCGAIRMIDEDGKAALRGRMADRFDVRRYAAGVCTIGQQATFFRRRAFERAGGFNVANRIAWDGELLVDMALSGARFARRPKVLGDFRIRRGTITSSTNYGERLREYEEVLKKKLQAKGISLHSKVSERTMRLGYKLNLFRHASYLFAR